MPRSPSPRSQNVLAGRYLIQKKLGSGSLGTVYLAHDQREGRHLALKILRPDRLSPEAVGRFQDEFGAIASLKHPQIAAAFDFGYTGTASLPYYTREYVEGSPLAAGPPGGAAPKLFLKPILDLLDALEYLHEHGVLHLDIHPGNLIASSDEARGAVLIDFGLFRSQEGPKVLASDRALVHLPPELLRKERLAPATDLYFAGRLLLYRLSGEPALEPRLPSEIPGWGPRLTLELERIAQKALDPDSGRRFQSAAELRDALARALGSGRREPRQREAAAVTFERGVEMRRIEKALTAAKNGHPAALCLRGPSGIGKSSLLSRARLRAQILGLAMFEVRCFPDAGPASKLVTALRGGEARPGWLEPLEAEHGGTPEERARREARAFFEEEGGPVAILLDDLDQADRASRVLAEALLLESAERRKTGAEGRGLCLICTSTASSIAGFGRGEALSLRPLGTKESIRLLGALAKPLRIPPKVSRRAAARAGGSPLRLRQIVQALIKEWGRAGSVPAGADLPDLPRSPLSADLALFSGIENDGRIILEALAVLGHPATVREIAAAIGEEEAAIQHRLPGLARAELIAFHGRGGARLAQISRPGAREELLKGDRTLDARGVHRRMVRHLENRPERDLREEESLARHLLLAGRRVTGLRQTFRVVHRLRRSGDSERGAALLEEALGAVKRVGDRFSLLEELSSILEEIGDHGKGISLLKPFHRESLAKLSITEAVRLRRRLGVHYHRFGRAEEAVSIFEEAERLADPRRDLEDLVFIDSELAELHTLRGRLEEAEGACRRGLERLAALRSSDPFRARMELLLRASRGHLELRRFHLADARADFREALRLSRRFRIPSTRAVILNNLGLAENQLNHLAAARRAFREAEKLFLAAGERRSLITIACNLAVIAARLGEREEARLEIDRAERFLKKVPGERLEFSVAYSRGIVASLLGEAETVLLTLPAAFSLGQRLGDLHLVNFGGVHLVEAQLACGRYEDAWKGLQTLGRTAEAKGPAILRRMVLSRRLLLATLLGRPEAAELARGSLERIHRSEVHLLEAWNDLFVGLAGVLSGALDRPRVEAAGETFRRCRVPAGEKSARSILLMDALGREDRPVVEREARRLQETGREAHRFLSVARPLLLSEAHAFLDNRTEAENRLSEASGAIIGTPFLELDWRIEFLRARLALKAGNVQGARAHLHRALHTRDLLEGLLPRGSRRRFLSHARFRKLAALGARLERSPRLFSSTRRSEVYEGMVGSAPGMVGVFQTIERLRDQELPILISGDTGTGKELVALALHRTGLRAEGPFFALHAGSLPLELFESELFGYQQGAFTGAEEDTAGLLERLAGGTLFFDEVGELPLAAQAKLLRVLAQGRARRLGSHEERPVNVRFLASSSADLRERVRTGAFRQDLYYRLAGMEIRLPTLRERKEDLPLLVRHFLEVHASRLDRKAPRVTPEAVALLSGHTWPGNVRELEGVILRALATLSPEEILGARQIEPLLGATSAAGGEPRVEVLPRVEDLLGEEISLEEMKLRVEKRYLRALFLKHRGDPLKIMEILGVKQSYYYSRMKDLGIDVKRLREEIARNEERS